jgi:hypothetical protein
MPDMTNPGNNDQPPIIPQRPNLPPPPYWPAGTPLPPPHAPKKKHTVRNVLLIVVAGLVALCGGGAIVAAATGDKPTATPATHQTYFSDCPFAAGGCPGASPAAKVTYSPTPGAPPSPTAPALTVSQQQALRKAQQYLDYAAFSRSGLIKQLQYEGFTVADATYAADAVGANWTAEADKKAKEYMAYSSFSHSGLVKQLEYEGFTAAQAEHGAKSVGL